MPMIDIYKLLISEVRYFLAVTFKNLHLEYIMPSFSTRSNILTKNYSLAYR